MGVDFTHFFTSPEVDSKVGDVLFEDECEPLFPFVKFVITQAGFNADWQACLFSCGYYFSCEFGGAHKAAAAATMNDRFVWAPHVNVDAFKPKLF